MFVKHFSQFPLGLLIPVYLFFLPNLFCVHNGAVEPYLLNGAVEPYLLNGIVEPYLLNGAVEPYLLNGAVEPYLLSLS